MAKSTYRTKSIKRTRGKTRGVQLVKPRINPIDWFDRYMYCVSPHFTMQHQ